MTLAPDAAIAWWNSKTDRERLILKGLGVAIAGVVFWVGVFTPLERLAEGAEARQAEASGALAQAQALSRQGEGASDAGRGLDIAAAEAAVRRLGAAGGVGIARVESQASELSVWTEPVAAKPLFAWLSGLQRDAGLSVRAFEAHRGEEGAVEARVVLTGAGS